jgi:hypothetical protein
MATRPQALALPVPQRPAVVRALGRPEVQLALVALLSRLPGLVSGSFYNVDESTVATMSMTMRSGGRLYQDVIDRKPPLLPLLYDATQWMFGTLDLRPVRVIALLALGATSLLLANEARRRYQLPIPTARLAALAMLVFAALPPEDAQAVGFELIALLPATLGFVLSARGRTRTGAALVGVAVLCKQTFALGMVPILLHAYRRRHWRGVAEVVGVFSGVLVVGAFVFGGRNFIYWAFVNASGYTAFDVHSLPEIARLAALMGLLLAASFSGPIVLTRWKSISADLDVYLWLATGVLGFILGFRFLGHYALQALPPVALLAMGGLGHAGRRRVLGVGLTLASAFVWVSLAGVPDHLHGTGTFDDVNEYVKDWTSPTDRIFVWGQAPQIYVGSDRLPASRFPHIQFLTDLSPGRVEDHPDYLAEAPAWNDLWADFAHHPPEVVIDTTKVDTGDTRTAVVMNSPLGPYLRTQYHVETTIDGATIYRRTAPANRAWCSLIPTPATAGLAC